MHIQTYLEEDDKAEESLFQKILEVEIQQELLNKAFVILKIKNNQELFM